MKSMLPFVAVIEKRIRMIVMLKMRVLQNGQKVSVTNYFLFKAKKKPPNEIIRENNAMPPIMLVAFLPSILKNKLG